MPVPATIAGSIRAEIRRQAEALQSVEREMSKLEPAYKRFRELVEKAEELKADVQEAAAILGPDEFLPVQCELEDHKIPLNFSVWALEDKLPLWRVMVRIVKHSPWIQVVDLQETLYELGFRVSRAAIESALTVHKKLYRIKRIERAKFVALRE